MDDRFDDPTLTTLLLASDVQAIGEALLDGDPTEARFRTAQMAAFARSLGRTQVADAAKHLADRLIPPRCQPGAGIGHAFAALSASVECR
jgi:hypothetical protein